MTRTANLGPDTPSGWPNRHPMAPNGQLEAVTWPLALTTWRFGQGERGIRANLAVSATTWWLRPRGSEIGPHAAYTSPIVVGHHWVEESSVTRRFLVAAAMAA